MNELATRPRRRHLNYKRIAEHWHARGLTRDGLWPACMGCAEGADDWSDLERAHLVDYSRDGLDHEGNVVLLCSTCHREMPSYKAGQDAAALGYVTARQHWLDRRFSHVRALVALGHDHLEAELGRNVDADTFQRLVDAVNSPDATASGFHVAFAPTGSGGSDE